MNDCRFRSVKTADGWKRWIRLHVNAVASEISEHAGRHTQAVLGDSAHAVPLMQSAVVVVSRYLMIKGEPFPLWPGRTKTLLRASFRRALQRYAAKMNRREVLGGTSDVEEAVLAFENSGQSFSCCMDPERVVRLLTDQSRAILALRDLGYRWKEIDSFLGVGESAARQAFEKELRLAIQLADHAESRQAQLQVDQPTRRDEKNNNVVPFTEPMLE